MAIMLQSCRFVLGLAKFIVLAIGCTSLAIPELHSEQRYQWPTLAEVLRQNSVPPPPGVDTALTITSFGLVNNSSEFAIAYYRYLGTDALEAPLHVLRYDKPTRRWHQHQFRTGEVKAPFTTGLQPHSQQPFMMDCLGSASISTARGSLLISTESSPSAACTMILDPKLKLISAFSGWKVAAIGSEILVERSEIHFAATHPLRLALVDVATGRERNLFPPAQDRLLTCYKERLAAVRDFAWCREHNAPCNPQQMSAELGKVAANADAKAVAIEVTLKSEGFGPAAESELGTERCFYVFKLAPKLEYREFRESDMQRRFGAATPDTLIRRGVLQRIFTTNNKR